MNKYIINLLGKKYFPFGLMVFFFDTDMQGEWRMEKIPCDIGLSSSSGNVIYRQMREV